MISIAFDIFTRVKGFGVTGLWYSDGLPKGDPVAVYTMKRFTDFAWYPQAPSESNPLPAGWVSAGGTFAAWPEYESPAADPLYNIAPGRRPMVGQPQVVRNVPHIYLNTTVFDEIDEAATTVVLVGEEGLGLEYAKPGDYWGYRYEGGNAILLPADMPPGSTFKMMIYGGAGTSSGGFWTRRVKTTELTV